MNSTSRLSSKRSIALISPIVPTWTMSSISPLPRLRNRFAAKCTSERFISIKVFRAYWYACVPSSRTCNRSKNRALRARASFGATFCGSSICGSSGAWAASAAVGWETRISVGVDMMLSSP
ncbi:hypothetical protein SGRI78S_07319 [Streptomyces griseus subsp. griseus]